MGKFDRYRIDLKGMLPDVQKHEYLLDNQFFIDIDGEEIQKGKVEVLLTITKKLSGVYGFDFDLKGYVSVPCDRCLDDVDCPVETTEHLVVKLGKDYSEESDEVVVIPESEGAINLAWFLYEFAALAIPVKHIHPPGKCNKQMSSKLEEHLVGEETADDNVDVNIDFD